MSNLVRALTPAQAQLPLANVSNSNALKQFFAPAAVGLSNIQKSSTRPQGGPLTLKSVADPGGVFSPTEAQQQAHQAQLDAAAQAAIPMPDANDQEVQLARRRAAALQQQRGGRASTILTGTTDSLGG